MPECSYRASTSGGKSGFPLKTCGNDKVTTNNFSATNSEPLQKAKPFLDTCVLVVSGRITAETAGKLKATRFDWRVAGHSYGDFLKLVDDPL
jgi:hypothetical protein